MTDDLIRDWRDTLEAISDDLNVDAVMSIADTIQKTADALAAAEAENARLRALLAKAVSREAAVKACNPHPDDGHLDRQCKWECQAVIDALPALTQPEGGDND